MQSKQETFPNIRVKPFGIHYASPPVHTKAAVDAVSISQATWSAFSTMSDTERNTLLKGLINRCGTSQIEFICTMLNFRGSVKCIDGKVFEKLTKTFALHPSEYAKKISSSTRPSKGIEGTYAKPWRQAPPKPPSAGYVRPEMINENFRPLVPGKDFDGLIDYFFPKDINERQKQSSASALTNTNMYTRLFNSQFDIKKVENQIKVTKPELGRKFAEFLTDMSKRLQDVMKSIQLISTMDSPEKTLFALRSSVLKALGAKHLTLYLMEESTLDFVVKCSDWLPTHKRLAGNMVYCSNIVMTQKTVSVFNVKNKDEYTTEIDHVYGGIEPECVLSVPVLNGRDKVAGILEVVNKESASPYFSSDDEFLLKTFAAICGLLAGGSLFSGGASEAGAAGAGVLSASAALISSELDLSALVLEMMKKVVDLVKAERCAVFLIDEERRELWSTLAPGAPEIRIPLTSGIAGHVASHGDICNIRDAYEDSRFNRSVDVKTGFRTRTILCLPMKSSKGKIIGVTQLINKIPSNQFFNKDDEKMLLSFSQLCAATIEKSLLLKSLQKALVDSETQKKHLNTMINATPDLYFYLDAHGKLIASNHPEKLLGGLALADAKSHSFEQWIGAKNELLLQDIKLAYKSRESLHVSDYSLILGVGDKVENVNYSIHQILKKEEADSGEFVVEGLFISLEFITLQSRKLNSLTRVMNPETVRSLLVSSRYLAGVNQPATILRGKIQNFGRIFQHLGPAKTISLLSEYYSKVSRTVTEKKGLVHTLEAESFMSSYGIPFNEEDDCKQAIEAALLLRRSASELAKENPSTIKELEKLQINIGISTGIVLSGNVGPPNRMEYLVLGDACNFSKQIESWAQIFGVDIIIDHETREKVKDFFHTREIDTLNLETGANTFSPTAIYEVIESKSIELPRDLTTCFLCFELGLVEYRQQNWLMAMSHFRKAIQLYQDQPSKVLSNRCKAILEGRFEVPKPGVWDFTWTAGEDEIFDSADGSRLTTANNDPRKI